MEPITSLAAATLAFVGGHFALSHPLRKGLVGALGEKGFLGLYSLAALAAMVWMDRAFRAVGPGGTPLWDGSGDAVWIIASVLTIAALALLLGSFVGNPALPQTGADAVAKARPVGAFAITRHPMMWGFALWGLSHILVMPSPRTLLVAGGVTVLALVGAHLQDRKKAALIGDAWTAWEAQTSYWPQLGKIGALGIGLWAGALAVWLGATWLHLWMAGVPAGVWRWIG